MSVPPNRPSTSRLKTHEVADTGSHIRIIRQLINSSIRVPEDACIDVRIVNSDIAVVSCFRCEEHIEIKTRYLSPTNRQWMIGKYIRHTEQHSLYQGRISLVICNFMQCCIYKYNICLNPYYNTNKKGIHNA